MLELRSSLRKWTGSSIIFVLSIRFQIPPNRHVRQAKVTRKSAQRQEPVSHGLGENPFGPTVRKVMSLRHVSLRETGWSRNPTSPGAVPGSKGKATHGAFRKYAFLASQKTSFERGRSLRTARSLFSAAGLRQQPQRQETTWATKKTWAARRNAATSTTPNRSKFSAGSKQCALAPPTD